MKTADILLHVPFELPGSILSWLDAHNVVPVYSRLYAGDPLPALDNVELLVMMGGTMSVNDEALFPWLTNEKRLVHEVVEAGKPVLGICLGAQLIASAFGATVRVNPSKEIGWYPLTAVGNNRNTFHFPESFTAFHWHQETFDLPEGAVLLAESQLCRNQAFQLGERAIGLQFHLEMTPQGIASSIEHFSDKLIGCEGVMAVDEISNVDHKINDEPNSLMATLMDWLTREEVV